MFREEQNEYLEFVSLDRMALGLSWSNNFMLGLVKYEYVKVFVTKSIVRERERAIRYWLFDMWFCVAE